MEKNITRRDFLKKSAVAGAAISTISACNEAATKAVEAFGEVHPFAFQEEPDIFFYVVTAINFNQINSPLAA